MAGFFLGMLIMCTGKKALCAVWKQKPEFNQRVFKKSIFRVILMILTCIFMHHHGQEGKHAYYRYRTRHNQTVEPMFDMSEQRQNQRSQKKHHRWGRELFGDDNQCVAAD
jgi:hypothetical protein